MGSIDYMADPGEAEQFVFTAAVKTGAGKKLESHGRVGFETVDL